MELDEAIDVTRQRAGYVRDRARIKAERGWENDYDLREAEAHETLLRFVALHR